MTPTSLFAVAVGGALGSVARYLCMTLLGRLLGAGFPWGTLFVNVTGSLVIGILAEVAALKWAFPEPWRLFLFVGVMGGYTTFSTFSLDVVNLMQRNLLLAGSYVAGSVVVGIAALFLGLALVRWLLA